MRFKRYCLAQNSPAIQQGRVATIQTLGGSGALKVGADFLKLISQIQKFG